MTGDCYVDASLFLGMHAEDETIRVACKNFFVARFAGGGVAMSLEQVGRCDALVWRYERALQDAYYPFMDVLHTDMTIERVPYREQDVKTALSVPALADLELDARLTLGMVLAGGGELVTVDRRLARRRDLPVRTPAGGPERAFPTGLEELYQRSLVLRVTREEL